MSAQRDLDLAPPLEASRPVPPAILVDPSAVGSLDDAPSSARPALFSPDATESTVPPPLPPRKSAHAVDQAEGTSRAAAAIPPPPALPPRRTGQVSSEADASARSDALAGGSPGLPSSRSALGGDVVSQVDVAAPLIELTEDKPPIVDTSTLASTFGLGSTTASPGNTSNKLELPPLPVLLLGPLLMLLAYWRVSLPSLGIACVGSWYLWADWRRRDRTRKFGKMEPFKEDRESMKRYDGVGLNGSPESVQWMNHAMGELWPVISTDILTPFIDLLEDAMLGKVPPMVSSVRLTSPSLGSEPFKVHSMRVMSDAEWFEHLSRAPSAPSNNTMLDKINIFSHSRSSSAASARSSRPTSLRSRASSSYDRQVREDEAADRKRREEVLQKINQRRSKEPALDGQRPDDPDQHESTPSTKQKPLDRNQGIDDDDDHQGEGRFVNLAVDFGFDGRKNKDAWSLHFICYMGFGVKGLGAAELPVWIDLLQVRGTVHVRMQLSSSPPFVQTGTVSMPALPDFDISAKPLKGFDVMNLPFTKTLMLKSIREVADTFVRPKSYTLDLDRLLLGQDASLRTNAIGVLQIRLHRAENLIDADTIGTSDPYAVVSFSRFRKPLFSTRTIVKTTSPRWEEDAFILIDSDTVASGERIDITLFDSDRFSADDSLGRVEIDLVRMLEQGSGENNQLRRHTSDLKPVHSGMKVRGTLEWSWGFFAISKLSSKSDAKGQVEKEELHGDKLGGDDSGTGRAGTTEQPGLLYRLMKGISPEPFPWELERRKRRLDSLAWLTGQRAREALEASQPPSEDQRCGVLNFHIHQAIELEMEDMSGTYTRKRGAGHGAVGGRPALHSTSDSPSLETAKPPSAYCEVILNGRLVFRTRTKQLSPAPYWNASSERFIRDWTKAKLVIVVRDERDREHDPIIGLAALSLASVFRNACQVTRIYPLEAGLGWGRLRVSLLFKAVDLELPPGISGTELASVHVHSLRTNQDLANRLSTSDKDLTVELQTDVDGTSVSFPDTGSSVDKRRSRSSFRPSRTSFVESPAPPPTPATQVQREDGDVDWWPATEPKSLAVQYRHSCSLLLKFVARNGKLKKDQVLGMALLHLSDLRDGVRRTLEVPLYETDDVNEAWEKAMDYRLANHTPAQESQRDAPDSGRSPHRTMIKLSLTLEPGISRAHRKLARRDKRLMHVYEAWKLARDMATEAEMFDERDRGKVVRGMVREQGGKEAEGGEIMGVHDQGRPDEDGDGAGDETAGGYTSDSSFASSAGSSVRTGEGPLDICHRDEPDDVVIKGNVDGSDEDDKSFYRKWRSHSKALHRRNKGIMQSGLMRTGKLLKDSLQAKVLAANDRAHRSAGGLAGGKNGDYLRRGHEVRQRGADMDLEIEGQSRL